MIERLEGACQASRKTSFRPDRGPHNDDHCDEHSERRCDDLLKVAHRCSTPPVLPECIATVSSAVVMMFVRQLVVLGGGCARPKRAPQKRIDSWLSTDATLALTTQRARFLLLRPGPNRSLQDDLGAVDLDRDALGVGFRRCTMRARSFA